MTSTETCDAADFWRPSQVLIVKAATRPAAFDGGVHRILPPGATSGIRPNLSGVTVYHRPLLNTSILPAESELSMNSTLRDSVCVAPAMTLSDREFQTLRDAAATVIRAVGVETGGSNVQFALNRETGEVVVIEMNPRVSRSSALASKATGYPIAKVATKLAIGYTLDEIPNDLTQTTPASFEPTLDYVVTKLPRFAFEKFAGADDTLTTQMKSVGEAMAIGRTFAESFGKALRSRELDATPRSEGSLEVAK